MLDLHIDLVVITVISFIVLMLLLNKLLYNPVVEFMEQRETSIQNDIDNANSNIGNVQEVEQEAQAIIDQAKAKAVSIKEEATVFAQQTQDKEISELKEQLDGEYEAFSAEIKSTRLNTLSAIKAQISSLKEGFHSKINHI